jgi:hypothetical protein
MRVFFAAYMIACLPSHVFETMGQLEQPLLEVARALVESFERIAGAVVAAGSIQPVDHSLTEGFVSLFMDYLRCFNAWFSTSSSLSAASATRSSPSTTRVSTSLPMSRRTPGSRSNVKKSAHASNLSCLQVHHFLLRQDEDCRTSHT